MLRARLDEALKAAIKAKEPRRVSTLRLILAAIKDRDIAARPEGNRDGVDEAEIHAILQKMVKQRHESIGLYEAGGRVELAAQEAEEIEIIHEFLPQQLGEAEIAAAAEEVVAELGATGLKDMGRTMAALKERYTGRMDFAKASATVKRLLG
ncbi:MAG: GatB/YqeY domain-containing protein [Alphaproteobacteria bacterium]|nr:GatB/YqeY domain-containing protein [Alphaproteobacteria bacterium]